MVTMKFQKTLRFLQREMQKQLRVSLYRGAFSRKEKHALHSALAVKSLNGTLRVLARTPKFFYTTRGMPKGPMTWLAGKTIPLQTRSGIVFRKATARSLANGQWYFPGRKARDYVQDAMAEVRKSVVAQASQEIKEVLVSELLKGLR